MAKRIEAVGVTSYYGSFKAIDGITMTIEPKSVTALIGPSGCGKSTFLRSINRMHEVLPAARLEGQLLIDGQNIYDRDIDVTAVRRMIGMVFQRPNPFPTMSIYDNVVAGLKLNGVRKKSLLDAACEKALRAANLWEEVRTRLSRPGAGLSGGQATRLAVARALLAAPGADLVLLDEPTAHLDERCARELRAHLRIVLAGHTVVEVTHGGLRSGLTRRRVGPGRTRTGIPRFPTPLLPRTAGDRHPSSGHPGLQNAHHV